MFVIFSKEGKVMERFLFDVERFPVVERAGRWVEFEERGGEDVDGKGKGRERDEGQIGAPKALNIVDIEEQLRATIRMLDYEGAKKSPLPDGCTYTIAVELRDDPAAMPPIGVSTVVSTLIVFERLELMNDLASSTLGTLLAIFADG